MVVGRLVSLGEGMMESHASSVVAETAEVRLWSLLLFHCNSHNFDLKS
jgi:hypothetical protein